MGWRWLPQADRKTVNRHLEVASPIFDALESADPRGLELAESSLIDLPGRQVVESTGPGDLLGVRVAAAEELRIIGLADDGATLALLPARRYRRTFAAIRLLEFTDGLSLPWDRHDVAALFSIARGGRGASTEQSRYRIHISDNWPAYAASLIVDRLVAPVRLDLYEVAVAAAESLAPEAIDGRLRKLIEIGNVHFKRNSQHDFVSNELLDRLNALLEPHEPY